MRQIFEPDPPRNTPTQPKWDWPASEGAEVYIRPFSREQAVRFGPATVWESPVAVTSRRLGHLFEDVLWEIKQCPDRRWDSDSDTWWITLYGVGSLLHRLKPYPLRLWVYNEVTDTWIDPATGELATSTKGTNHEPH